MNPLLHNVVRVSMVVGALGGGVGIFASLAASKPEPERKERPEDGVVVQVQHATRGDLPIAVTGHGLVIPAEQIDVQAEVVAKVVWRSQRLIAGGRFRTGDTLLRLDARDYKLATRELAARVERADVALDVERGRKKIAEREWELLDDAVPEDPSGRARALREPQIRAAENDLRAARAGHQRAELLVSKTVLRAPFNGMVMKETVGKGQLVSPGLPLVTLVSTDTFLVQVSIPTDRLASIRIPGVNAARGKGSSVLVRQDLGRGAVERSGQVVRLLGDLDPDGQMARVVVEVEDPLGLRRTPGTEEQLPLLLGAHVQVEIDAGLLENVVEVPRSALRNGADVFVMEDGRLDIRPVQIVWRAEKSVFVTEGLDGGEQLVTSRVAAPVQGMRLLAKAAGVRPASDRLAATHNRADDRVVR